MRFTGAGILCVMPNRRLLVVHAHPDDEVITTGGLIARHTAAGDQVTLVTCTLGEEGEILLPDIAHLAANQSDELGLHRIEELAAAMEALGVTDSRILGGAHTYRDSGMMGEPSNDRPNCFWRADLTEAADHLVSVIREVRPEVTVTYDQFGGYGHPDHIQAHRVATYATALAVVRSYRPELGPPWDTPRLFWTALPAGQIRAGIEALRELGDTSPFATIDPDDIPFAVPDDAVDAVIDVRDHMAAKQGAMRAHASQINLDEGFFALSNNIGSPVFRTEYFRLAKGQLPAGQVTDLFDGLP